MTTSTAERALPGWRLLLKWVLASAIGLAVTLEGYGTIFLIIVYNTFAKNEVSRLL